MNSSPSSTTRFERMTPADAQRVSAALARIHQIVPDSVDGDGLVQVLIRGGGTTTAHQRRGGVPLFMHLIVRPANKGAGLLLYCTAISWNAAHVPQTGLRSFSRGDIEQSTRGGPTYVFWGESDCPNAFEFTRSRTEGCFDLMIHTNLRELDLRPLLAR